MRYISLRSSTYCKYHGMNMFFCFLLFCLIFNHGKIGYKTNYGKVSLSRLVALYLSYLIIDFLIITLALIMVHTVFRIATNLHTHLYEYIFDISNAMPLADSVQ
jgi:hypothetical protein